MTQVVRLKLSNLSTDESAANKAIENECNVRLAAGFRLATAFVVAGDLVLVFQK